MGHKITEDMIITRVSEKEGLSVGTNESDFIVLDLNLTDKLISEGLAREFVSKIQNLRKEMDFLVNDRITISYNAEDLVIKSINDNLDYVKSETLAIEIIVDETITKDTVLNEYPIGLSIKNNNI